MATWITRIDEQGDGPRVAVKDLIDVVGVPTTAGCAGVADLATAATTDAACVQALRAGGARVAGKANLHELAFGGSGLNPWFGDPVNPLDPTRIPGGSSSGCAVALATGEADLALGTDSAGSVRTPAACCGITALKTTWGRIPVDGVWPLAPSLDCVGPMAVDVEGLVATMRLLEPGFAPAAEPASFVGRVRLPGTDPVVDIAIDARLAASELEVVELELSGWGAALAAAVAVLYGEAWRTDRPVYEHDPERIGAHVRRRLEEGAAISAARLAAALDHRDRWRAELADAFARAPVLALPTLRTLAPPLDDPEPDTRTANAPINLAGHPALALPVPTGGLLPASLQLVAPDGGDELLLATGALLEAAG